ncbi:SUMF1/EgtB/PvdO family nonheme iron enzyme [Pseudomonas sp. LPH60]|uniref:formylglycine-generating enzyme family protein n=1 Tax=Pseudomonas sp. LPH60 TaxID=3065906 RepID=UPI00273C45F2|nr:SUMF1/EgtB/PvdO family nonheme iron enzyme [Pseudomonas sp. LPH60]MDP4571642.1 SUMF1/EgtB/PvdO family nonheme iron enzyme [Pseudomonas sp. LPH60]
MKQKYGLALCVALLIAGCEKPEVAGPPSKALSAEKVAEIASTISRKYPDLSPQNREAVLNTVIRSLDNMVLIEGGEFQMGDFGWPHGFDPLALCQWPCGVDPAKMERISLDVDDDFVHPVKLSSYYLSSLQTTLGDFDLFFLAQGKPPFDAELRKREDMKQLYLENLPAPASRSWQEAKDYCGWLADLSGYRVDLPTEAQWEYAARNRGQPVMFATDNGNLDYGRNFPAPDDNETFAVDRFVPNPLGLYNLTGNASEWVNDWYDKHYYRESPVENPQGPETGIYRAQRGANNKFANDPTFSPSASTVRRWRWGALAAWNAPGVSFRCAIQSAQPL